VRKLLVLAPLALLLVACSPSGPQTVEITLNEFGILSSQTDFEVGQTYQFSITNMGALNHEFTIMPAGVSMMMDGHGMDMGHNMEGAFVHVVEDQLGPGASMTIEFTFSEEYAAGELEFACHLAGHYEAGMFAPITVNS
jgi:uncharacterized cupredoxin-like copper-binding protein